MGRTTEYTQRGNGPSGVHSIMIEKLAQAGGAGGGGLHTIAHPTSFTIFTIMYKVTGTLQLIRQIHSPYFMPFPMYSVERTFAWAAALVHEDIEY